MSAIPQITPENEQFLRAAVAGGIFPSRTEAIDRAVGLLRERQEAMDRILAKPVPLPPLPHVLELSSEGVVYLRGHRVGLHLILTAFYRGETAEQIQDRFSTMSLQEVEQVLTFVRQHPDAMRAYLDQQQMIARLALDDVHRGPTTEELRTRWQSQFGKPFESSCP